MTGVSYVRDDDPVNFSHVKTAGALLVHRWINWAQVAPASQPSQWDPTDPADPHYDWHVIDSWVAGAVRAGLVPMLQVFGAPAWAQGCLPPGPLEEAPCSVDPSALAAFAQAAARRYSGTFGGLPRVRFWQAENEPNMGLFFQPQFKGRRLVSPGEYRRLLNAFSTAVKAVDPTDFVVAAGLAPVGGRAAAVAPLRFARQLLCMAGRRDPHPTQGSCEGGLRFDAFDIHPYTTGGPRHKGPGDDVELGDLDELQELLHAADQAGRIHGLEPQTPLWITEFSWDSKPPDPGGLPLRIGGRWVAEALYMAWKAGVTRFFWFTIRDDVSTPAQPFSATYQSGLYFRGAEPADDRPKRVMYAFRFPFVAYSRGSGFFFWGRTPTSDGGSVAIETKQREGWQRSFVAHADRHGIFTGVVHGLYGQREKGAVRARYRGEASLAFSLKRVREFHQPPFG
ncbi:MAG TPA: hypothetical protein VFN89_10325 [Solirubrobacterales bacterium]|nr:hypothetical protein [Solirubrobacterales bacterium]